MDIIDGFYNHIVLRIPPDNLTHILQRIKNKTEQEIENIKSKISKYEEKKRAEAALYQSLTPFKKLFAGRPPSHHQAVEYMFFVKERFKKIDKLKKRIDDIEGVIQLLGESKTDKIVLSSALIKEIKAFKEMEER
ncbi:hypothetical protein EV207_107121 [Scopulibacillus darangshiensis]|uniref:Uncharacterized protein n=1 Tax=Scopulibacillus darangshiensis TaxID=442528 RepID=A0A4V2SN75_9BACL|nr:hypothetical protein [Scopulibacillus darangshiensis]TCP30026.1 hypothetical protein EV207_107121 [Scopulibacillus darangshiensis]